MDARLRGHDVKKSATPARPCYRHSGETLLNSEAGHAGIQRASLDAGFVGMTARHVQ
jgi:hypothetical protein